MTRAESFQRLLRRFVRGLLIVGIALLVALGALWATLRIALMPAAAPSPLTPAQVESMLKSTARPLPGACSGGCGAAG